MRSVLFPAMILAFVIGCGGGDSPPEPPAPPPTPVDPPTPPTPTPTETPTPSGFNLPSGDLRGNAKLGKVVYGQFCGVCHGAGGKGDGPTAATLNPKPADHTDHVFMSTLTDEHLYKVIALGGKSIGKSPLMAAWGAVLTEDQIKDVIGFLRQLSSS